MDPLDQEDAPGTGWLKVLVVVAVLVVCVVGVYLTIQRLAAPMEERSSIVTPKPKNQTATPTEPSPQDCNGHECKG